MRRFLRLRSTDRALLIRSLVMLCAIRMSLWLLPHCLLRRVLMTMARRPIPPRGAQARPDRIVWAVIAASRYIPATASCLPRALAAQVLLARSGHAAQLRLGVALGAHGAFAAHAWVKSGERILVGAPADPSRFVPLPPAQGGIL
jgi:hypothetical protein